MFIKSIKCQSKVTVTNGETRNTLIIFNMMVGKKKLPSKYANGPDLKLLSDGEEDGFTQS